MEKDNVLNLGIPSQTSKQILLRSNLLKEYLLGKNLVIIAGANDIKSIMTNKNRDEQIVLSCLNNIKNIVDNHLNNLRKLVTPSGLFLASSKNVETGYDKAWLRDNVSAFVELQPILENVSIGFVANGDKEARHL